MTTITTGRSRTLWVEVMRGSKITVSAHLIREQHKDGTSVKELLPPGQWEFLSLLKDVTEEQAARIVDREDGYDAYKEYYKDGNFVNIKAIHSLSSLMMDNNIDSSKSWAILIETKK